MKIRTCTFLILISLFTLLCCQKPFSNTDAPLVKNGAVDLSRWHFLDDGPIRLNGQWEFYWQQLLTPKSMALIPAEAKQFYSVPAVWHANSSQHPALADTGFGTYRLQIQVADTTQLYAIKIKEIYTACRLWINGRQIYQCGTVAPTSKQADPAFKPRVISFSTKSPNIELILQVSNFHYKKGGIRDVLEFGLHSQLQESRERVLVFNFVLFGSLLMMGFYHLGLYGLRKSDSSPLYFGLFCLIIAARIPAMGNGFMITWFPEISWRLNITIIVLGYYIAVQLFITFLSKLYKDEFNTNIVHLLQGLGGLFSLIVLLFPPMLFTKTESLYQGIILLGGIYTIRTLIKALRRKRSGALLVILGFLVLFLTAINDILYAQYIITNPNFQSLTPFGLFIFIFSQSFIISRRFSQAFCRIESMSEELQEKNKQLARLDKLKDEFLANTSHELKTPVSGMIGLSQSLIKGIGGPVTEIQKDNLNMIVQSGRRLTHLINDILDFSKMKHHGLELNLKPTDIKSVARLVLNMAAPLLHDKPVQLIEQIPDTLPLINADENRFNQILTNLISNAVKFTHKGSIILRAEPVNGGVRISVSDTGIGISADKQASVFQAFEQADGSANREYGGTGLGLAVTRQLIELHGSHIRLESREGHGSIFMFDMPALSDTSDSVKSAAVDMGALQPERISPHAEKVMPKQFSPSGQCGTILIVDDEAVNIRVLQNHLSLNQYHVLTAKTGSDALKILEQTRPDLVLLDLMMPRMNGFEVCEKIRLRYTVSELPILILTAKNQPHDLTSGFSAGANDYLTKPFSSDELLARVELHLNLLKANKTLTQHAGTLEKQVKERTHELKKALNKIGHQSEEQKELLHILCHDLANPLSSLSTLLEMSLQDQALYHELAPMMQVSVKNGMETIDLVRQMRALADKDLPMALEKVCLKQMVQESETILRQRLNEKQINLVTNIDASHTVLVEKVSFVNSVLNNLLSNAIKFSYMGHDIRLESFQKQGYTYLSIIDQGMGMPPQLVQDLFDVSKATSRQGTQGETGTGFGMPLVKKFVDAFGGRIKVVSEEKTDNSLNYGTEITLILKAK